ncbi:Por secretion system C-terminal sorting domain-containing protein [Chryseobacterium ureilyticum]|uniref:Por secretion system C-terminal sorting domain-containing protein n=1 Tax=Chryseobacterium ureilyticum TaxID=373668 RepID=A0A1N7KZU4_9FLAO|nr:T9SS type A sorting domain-containing protein [Chryseobacterium ureilyticum]SIS67103.1 Por secretion system C-terminal sorting domain-containing protein [Chryseobacterium ureilyticum]
MKKLLLSITAIAGIIVHAQTALHGADWNLKKIVINNTTYSLPQNSEMGSPILTFSATPNTPPPPGSTTSMSNPICGTGIWALIYNNEITANSFNFWSHGTGTTNCTMPENIAFHTQYNDYFSIGSNSYSYQILDNGGMRNLIITNSLGHQAFYQSGTLGTKESKTQLSNKAGTIYPNPVKEGSVHLKKTDRIEWIKVYNMEGKLVLQNLSSDAEINVSNLLKGGYFMEVKSQSGISRHQFIKE